jgi:hypothetical protein
MSTLRIRFRFNQQSGKASVEPGGKHFGNFSRVLVQQVAVQYGSRTLGLIRDHIESQIQTDVQRELDNMARLLMSHVVGVSGRNSGPTGALGTVAPESEEMRDLGLQVKNVSLRGLVRDGWTPRSPYYLKWRSRHDGNTAWFRRHSPGRLDALRSGQTWSAAFGGIAVTVLKHTDLNQGEQWRLGGNPHTVPFRPTIQPFLGYFLTRAMPNAVFKRIEQGFSNQRWKWTDVGGAGRTAKSQRTLQATAVHHRSCSPPQGQGAPVSNRTHRSFTLRVEIPVLPRARREGPAEGIPLNQLANRLLRLGLDKHISLDSALRALLLDKIVQTERSRRCRHDRRATAGGMERPPLSLHSEARGRHRAHGQDELWLFTRIWQRLVPDPVGHRRYDRGRPVHPRLYHPALHVPEKKIIKDLDTELPDELGSTIPMR